MAVLNDGDEFFDEVAGDSVKNSFEEGLVVVQLKSELEFELEPLPNLIILTVLGAGRKPHLFTQEVVEFSRVFPVLTQGVHLDEAWLVAAFLGNVELIGNL